MLQKLSLFSLMLSALFILSISSCSKPTSDAKAKELAVGTWKGELGEVTFSADGKVCAKQNGKDHCGTYTITKDKVTITRQGGGTNDQGVTEGGIEIFPKGQNSIDLPIVKLTKKVAVVKFKGKEYTLNRG